MNRRRVLKGIGAAAALTGVGLCGRRLLPPSPSAHLESANRIARALFASLEGDARRAAVVPYDHPLRQFHNRGVPAGGVLVMSLARAQRQMVTDLLYAGLSRRALRKGSIRSGDIYALETWGNAIDIADIKGDHLSDRFASELRAAGVDVRRDKTYRVATSWLERIGDPRQSRRGPLLRDATIAYLRAHGFA